jgi:beta-lactamase class A
MPTLHREMVSCRYDAAEHIASAKRGTIVTTAGDTLYGAIERIIDEADVEEFGVYIRHLPSGETTEIHGDDLYPLASVLKIPVLLETLAQVDAGERSLAERIHLLPEHRLAPSGVLVELDSGLQPTLRDLLTLMIIVSDNTATDMVLDRIGAPRVMDRMRHWALESVYVHMGVTQLFRTALSPADAEEDFVSAYRRLAAAGPVVDPSTGEPHPDLRAMFAAGPNYESLPARRSPENNVASPHGMGSLLERLIGGDLLSPEGTSVALDILLRQQLNLRIPRFLPMGTPVAHKTGTFLDSRNDAGIMYLPDGGRIVVVTFALLRRDRLAEDALTSVPYIDGVDGAMGRIARAAFDAYSPLPDA